MTLAAPLAFILEYESHETRRKYPLSFLHLYGHVLLCLNSALHLQGIGTSWSLHAVRESECFDVKVYVYAASDGVITYMSGRSMQRF